MSLKIKREIWQASKTRDSAELVRQFVSVRDMEKYLKANIKCPENKDNFNKGRHEWNDSTVIDGVGDVRAICDFCGLFIVDKPLVNKMENREV